jgi:hypothetical protein
LLGFGSVKRRSESQRWRSAKRRAFALLPQHTPRQGGSSVLHITADGTRTLVSYDGEIEDVCRTLA